VPTPVAVHVKWILGKSPDLDRSMNVLSEFFVGVSAIAQRCGFFRPLV
jgi:hypothetical protein